MVVLAVSGGRVKPLCLKVGAQMCVWVLICPLPFLSNLQVYTHPDDPQVNLAEQECLDRKLQTKSWSFFHVNSSWQPLAQLR